MAVGDGRHEEMLGIHNAITHQHTHTACSHREEIDSHPPQTSTQSRNMTFDFFFPPRLPCRFYFTQRNPIYPITGKERIARNILNYKKRMVISIINMLMLNIGFSHLLRMHPMMHTAKELSARMLSILFMLGLD